MHIHHSLKEFRPVTEVTQKKANDFNRPKVRYGGKLYDPSHPMYESIRRLILERYSPSGK